MQDPSPDTLNFGVKWMRMWSNTSFYANPSRGLARNLDANKLLFKERLIY
jgi:hypothetical protein